MLSFLKGIKYLEIKKLIIFLVIFVTIFLFFDILFLKIIPRPCLLTEPNQITKFRFIHNSSCKASTDEYSVQYKINEIGLRDYPIEKKKPDDEYRILFLGDSFTEGQGIQIEDTFVKKLEDLLKNADFSKDEDLANKKIRTINAGVAGYSTVLEYLYLKNRGIELNPDQVIVDMNVTDFTEERANLKNAVRNEDGEITGVSIERKRHLPYALDDLLKKNSFSYNMLLSKEEELVKLEGRISAFLKGEKAPEYAKSSTDFVPGDLDRDLFAITRQINDEKFKELFNPVTTSILRIRDLLKEKNVPMYLVYVPNGHEVDKNEWTTGRVVMKLSEDNYPTRLNDSLKEFANQNEIPFLDLTDGFKLYLKDHQPGLYYKYDGHLTPLGDRVASELLYNFLTNNDLIK